MDPRNNPIGELNRFLYSRCYDMLRAAVAGVLGRPVAAVIHQNQICVEVDEDRIFYTFHAFVEYRPEEEAAFQFTVTVSLDGCSWALEVIDAVPVNSGEHGRKSRYGVYTDQHLIPRLYRDEQREAEAERFLRRYCPEALAVPMPVPIRSVMEGRMGLKVNAGVRLADDAYGQIVYGDREIQVKTDEGEEIRILSCKRGDVLIDGDQVLLRGIGAMNCTLAHEAYHWFAHRAYVDFHRLTGEQGDSSYNGMSKYSSADILEIQANAMAYRILMPEKTFLLRNSGLAEKDIHERISLLASFFRVSYPAATIRMAQLGLYDFCMPTETVRVTPADACDVYCSDDGLRELVDTERIVYTDDRYVYNRPEFVEQVWEDVPKYGCSGTPYRLTEYAVSHPEEAFIRFRIDHRRVIDHGSDILQARSDAFLRAQVETIRREFPEVGREMKLHAKRFEQVYRNEKGKETFSELAAEMINYRYGFMDEFDPAAAERVWHPETEMPETHERYFAGEDDKEESERRYMDNLAVRKIDPETKKIAEEASSPVDLFCADTLQPRQYYEKIMKGKAGQPDNSTLMSLCVGLCLSFKASARLFRAAGRALSGSRTDMAYRYILLHLRGKYIEDVNVFLDELALDPLGAKKNVAL